MIWSVSNWILFIWNNGIKWKWKPNRQPKEEFNKNSLNNKKNVYQYAKFIHAITQFELDYLFPFHFGRVALNKLLMAANGAVGLYNKQYSISSALLCVPIVQTVRTLSPLGS